MRNPFFLTLIASLVSGCSVAPLSPAELNINHRGKSHTLITQEAPDFQIQSSKKGIGALGVFGIGAQLIGLAAGKLASDHSGRSIANKYQIRDQVAVTGATLSELLLKNHASNVSKTLVLDKGKAPLVSDLALAADSKGLVLFVRTTSWGLAEDYHHGHVFFYAAEASLIDAQSMKVLSKVPCDFTNDVEGKKLPNRDAYFDNDGNLLTQLAKEGAEYCRQHLMANFPHNVNVTARSVPITQPASAIVSSASQKSPSLVPPAKVFADYTSIKKHKALAVSLSGKHWYYASGDGPAGTPLSADPTIRSLQRCEAAAQEVCRLYSVDDKLL